MASSATVSAPKKRKSFSEYFHSMRGQQLIVTLVFLFVPLVLLFMFTYRNYYSLFNDDGVVGDIVTAEEEMLAVLNRELRFTALKQLFVTAAILSLENTLLALLPLGFNDLMHGYFRTLCVGYGLYAVGNTILMILLYFTDYGGAVAAAVVFAVSASGLTALSMAFDPAFYGFGFLIGAAPVPVGCLYGQPALPGVGAAADCGRNKSRALHPAGAVLGT